MTAVPAARDTAESVALPHAPRLLPMPFQPHTDRWRSPSGGTRATEITVVRLRCVLREAYRLRRLTQEVAVGLAERRRAEALADPSPTRRWCG